MTRIKPMSLGIALGVAGASGLHTWIDAAGPAGRQAIAQPAAQQGDPMAGFPDLAKGLRETEGCLGVETARTGSGKNVIFAWFENKAAAMRWHESQMHRGAMRAFFPDGAGAKQRTPMEGVPDNVPIMAIASITFTDRPQLEQTNLPISQIAIELYSPLDGGIFLNGRFAPDALQVNNMLNAAAPTTN